MHVGPNFFNILENGFQQIVKKDWRQMVGLRWGWLLYTDHQHNYKGAVSCGVVTSSFNLGSTGHIKIPPKAKSHLHAPSIPNST